MAQDSTLAQYLLEARFALFRLDSVCMALAAGMTVTHDEMQEACRARGAALRQLAPGRVTPTFDGAFLIEPISDGWRLSHPSFAPRIYETIGLLAADVLFVVGERSEQNRERLAARIESGLRRFTIEQLVSELA